MISWDFVASPPPAKSRDIVSANCLSWVQLFHSLQHGFSMGYHYEITQFFQPFD